MEKKKGTHVKKKNIFFGNIADKVSFFFFILSSIKKKYIYAYVKN